jgi:hypothetical protein
MLHSLCAKGPNAHAGTSRQPNAAIIIIIIIEYHLAEANCVQTDDIDWQRLRLIAIFGLYCNEPKLLFPASVYTCIYPFSCDADSFASR